MSHGFNEARVKVAHPYLTMMGLYLGGFTGMFSETCLNIALPQLGVAFGVATAITQWLVIGYMLVIGLVMPFASILMKWFSIRKLTLFSLGMFIAGSLVSGCAPTFEVLLFGRLVQGIGTGLVLPMMFSMVLEVFPPCKIGAAMGVTALIIMFAPAIGPTLSGILLGVFSWRAIFFSFVVVLAAGVAFALKFLVNPLRIDATECRCAFACAFVHWLRRTRSWRRPRELVRLGERSGSCASRVRHCCACMVRAPSADDRCTHYQCAHLWHSRFRFGRCCHDD